MSDNIKNKTDCHFTLKNYYVKKKSVRMSSVANLPIVAICKGGGLGGCTNVSNFTERAILSCKNHEFIEQNNTCSIVK